MKRPPVFSVTEAHIPFFEFSFDFDDADGIPSEKKFFSDKRDILAVMLAACRAIEQVYGVPVRLVGEYPELRAVDAKNNAELCFCRITEDRWM